MMFIYNFVLFLLFIPALLVFIFHYRGRISAEFVNGWMEKVGFWNIPANINHDNRLLWIHCASLGEIRAVEPLLRQLKGYRPMITTLTVSGRNYAKQNNLAEFVFFSPIDFSFITSRLIRKLRPCGMIIMETELWPGLISSAWKNNVGILIINGRMSYRSYPIYRFVKFFWRRVLEKISYIAFRSEEDEERYLSLGLPENRAQVTGNIKYDISFNDLNCKRENFGFINSDKIIVAGSTRNGEENILLDSFFELKKKYADLKLVLAPRHLHRIPKVINEIEKRGLKYSLRSKGTEDKFDCLLIDTFGELVKFYSLCDISFVGGSLVKKGGQNPIEPATYAKPVLFGPHMENFISESKIILKYGGGFIVNDSREFIMKVELLLSDSVFRQETGIKARRSVESQKGALKKTLDIIEQNFGKAG